MSAQLSWNDVDVRPTATPTLRDFWVAVLAPLASLKLTVVLFALSIFIILAGTLAQVEHDIWDVIRIYFRAPIAWIDPKIFFPPTFVTPSLRAAIPDGLSFPFPGGWLIGAMMALNLVAAHLVRFQVQARGLRLYSGLAVIAVGAVMTGLVVRYGDLKDGLTQDLTQTYDYLWLWLRILAGAAWLVLGWVLYRGWRIFAFEYAQQGVKDKGSLIFRILVLSLLTSMFLRSGWLVYLLTATRLDDPSMRILWQLSKGSMAAVVLLIGCGLVFGKRAGVTLLHGGVGLMMFGELLVGLVAVEGQMPITEGESANFVHDVRTWELAIIDPSDPKEDRVTVIPKAKIVAATKEGAGPISDDSLPFRIQVVKLLDNSAPRELKPGEDTPATKGLGTQFTADEKDKIGGTDSTGGIDQTAAWLRLTSLDGEDLGTYLTSLTFSMLNLQDDVKVGDKTYRIALRFKRTYKPYSIALKDVRKVDYIGTSTPKDYSSDVVINDPTRNVSDREVKIWMNNPLRFAGETFYQSNYAKDPSTGEETTTLAVVSNTGWMIPYVGCMIVAFGMFAHFMITLFRFLDRQLRADAADPNAVVSADPRRRAAKRAVAPKTQATLGWPGWVVPGAVAVLAAAAIGMRAQTPPPVEDEFDFYRFGQLPVVADGRAKPVDTLARHTLLAISGKSTWKDANEETQPAVRWFLDMMAAPRVGAEHEVIRIENLEVQEQLGLPRREGFRYALADIYEQIEKFGKEVERATGIEAVKQSVYQRKLIELDRKLEVFNVIFRSFIQPPIGGEEEQLAQSMIEQMTFQRQLRKKEPPFAVPPLAEGEEWETYASGWLQNVVKERVTQQPTNPFAESWERIFNAYARGASPDEQESSSKRETSRREAVKDFNSEVAKLHALYREKTPKEVDLAKVEFESYFNRTQPMSLAMMVYVAAFAVAAVSWLLMAFNWPGGFLVAGRTAFVLALLALVVHTAALWGRMHISGRPPVTNLYSSAVFIGWGCAALGLVLESVLRLALKQRLGLGVVVATVAGYSTLLIAHNLEADGSDTFSVMQAVLDTQFWLATHVTCITFGYATTYLAGLFGLNYILLGVLTPALTPQLAKDLNRMTYGTLCFSIFFSFVGTVLGGLWADDSWGRFWGWDPKENGALMIVLWNALALHARWGGMVKERGLAVLSVIGNVVVSWSWFGVNALSVGLHSYGFDSKIFTLFSVLTLAHVPLILLGLVPRNAWLSAAGKDDPPSLAV